MNSTVQLCLFIIHQSSVTVVTYKLSQRTPCYPTLLAAAVEYLTVLLLFIETAGVYYKWEEGVKIRKNLELLESWASENNVEQANNYLTKAVAIADFLATSKQFLLQVSFYN